MKLVSKKSFMKWTQQHKIERFGDSFRFTDQFIFRIPIGDYHLQLDYRIRELFSLIPPQPILVVNRFLRWHILPPSTDSCHFQLDPYKSYLKSLGIPTSEEDDEVALQFQYSELLNVFTLAYLTNRWGTSENSLYVIPEHDPTWMIYCCGSYESVFVYCINEKGHDQLVEKLNRKTIPTYGPHVKNPIPLPTYKPIDQTEEVDPETGKPCGNSSFEAWVLPEFLPPEE